MSGRRQEGQFICSTDLTTARRESLLGASHFIEGWTQGLGLTTTRACRQYLDVVFGYHIVGRASAGQVRNTTPMPDLSLPRPVRDLSTVAEVQQPEAVEVVVPDAASVEVPPGRKPRSGYARLKSRHRHLIEMHESLQADFDGLLAKNQKLEAELAELDQAFGEITRLNAELAGELRRARQQRPAPSAFSHLLGHP